MNNIQKIATKLHKLTMQRVDSWERKRREFSHRQIISVVFQILLCCILSSTFQHIMHTDNKIQSVILFCTFQKNLKFKILIIQHSSYLSVFCFSLSSTLYVCCSLSVRNSRLRVNLQSASNCSDINTKSRVASCSGMSLIQRPRLLI